MNEIQKNNYFSVLVIAVAIVIAIVSFTYPFESSYFPRTLAIFLGLMALILFVRMRISKKPENQDVASKQPSKQLFSDSERIQLKSAASTFGMVGLYALSILLVNYEISTFIFLIILMLYLGYRKPVRVVAIAAGLTASLYGIFFMFLGVSRPESILFNNLF